MPVEIEPGSNKDFYVRQISRKLGEERVLGALDDAITYAKLLDMEDDLAYFKKVKRDTAFTRRLGYLESVKLNPETAALYYEEDLHNDPYEYDVKTEKRVAELKIYLSEFVARAMAEDDPYTALFGKEE